MLINPATLEALRTDFYLTYQGAYASTPVWFNDVTTVIPSTTKSNTYGWVEKAMNLRKWIGPRIAHNLKGQSYNLVNDDYEGTIEVDRNDIDDDNLGMYKAMIVPELGQAAKKNPDQLIAAMMTDNTALAYDGLALFHDAHTIGSSTYDNNNALPLSVDAIDTVYQQMVGYVDEAGNPLLVRPTHILHAPQLRRKVLEAIASTTIARAVTNLAASENVAAAAIDNVMKGWLIPIEVPEWGATAKQWALADCSKPVKPFVLQMRKPAQFVARDNPQDPKVFDQKVFTYGVDGRWAPGITLPFLISRGNLST